MEIQAYDFGTIVINDRVYAKDVIVYPDHVLNYWVRKDDHTLEPSDLVDAIKENPKQIIIGTGYSGVMQVLQETKKFLKARKIKFKILNSREAVKEYQELSERKKKNVVLAIHLTC